MNRRRDILKLEVISWALYDFANTIYSMNIISLYFASWLVIDLGYRDINYAVPYAGSMLLAGLLMPALGYLSDGQGDRKEFSGRRKVRLLGLFTFGAVAAVVAFALLPPTAVVPILILFAISNFFYEGGMVFYNALLGSVSSGDNVGKISGFGVALGYLGSIVGMVLVLPFVSGELFGLDIPLIVDGGKSAAFLPTAIYFGLFSLPIIFFVRERRFNGAADGSPLPSSERRGLRQAYRDIWASLRTTEKYPGLLRFLIADYCFEDAIATVIAFMAVFTEKVFDFTSEDKTIFFIVSTVFAIVGAYFFGRLADRYTPKKVLFFIVAAWIGVLIGFVANTRAEFFWILGPLIGVLLGGVWSVSRPLLMQLVPPEKLGQFFGLFSISGRAAAICGPLVWGGVVYLFEPGNYLGKLVAAHFDLSQSAAAKLPYRLGVLALALMMAVGLYLFRKVPDKGKQK